MHSHFRDGVQDELLQFIGSFDSECPADQDLCDDINFDLLIAPPVSTVFDLIEDDCTFHDDDESMQRSSSSGITVKTDKYEIGPTLISEGSLEESCFAGLSNSDV